MFAKIMLPILKLNTNDQLMCLCFKKNIYNVQWNLCNPTPDFSDILWHTTPKIYGLKVFLLTKLNLSIQTSCTIRHVRLYRMSEPVYSDTPKDQGKVSDCTGCQNLSNLTHQRTREKCRIVQDVWILRFNLVNRNTLRP
jgi:hypothetical protein